MRREPIVTIQALAALLLRDANGIGMPATKNPQRSAIPYCAPILIDVFRVLDNGYPTVNGET
jgi:hypothetical protein